MSSAHLKITHLQRLADLNWTSTWTARQIACLMLDDVSGLLDERRHVTGDYLQLLARILPKKYNSHCKKTETNATSKTVTINMFHNFSFRKEYSAYVLPFNSCPYLQNVSLPNRNWRWPDLQVTGNCRSPRRRRRFHPPSDKSPDPWVRFGRRHKKER